VAAFPFLLPPDEIFDIGLDTRTPVDDKDYQMPFRFSGKIDKLTFKLGPVRLASLELLIVNRHIAIAKD